MANTVSTGQTGTFSADHTTRYTQPVLQLKDKSGNLPENQRKHSADKGWQGQTYYQYPPIKKPHWSWLVALYFWVGGISAGCQILATIVEGFGRKRDRKIVSAGRYLSLLTILFAPILLVLDLGRPKRFINMLRIFKPTSVMSLGSWGITAFGGVAGMLAFRQAVDDGFIRPRSLPGRLIRLLPKPLLNLAAFPLSLFVGSYTAVLLVATNVPLWAKSKLSLGPLFLGSAMSTGTSAITLALAATDSADEATLRRLETYDALALFTELVNIAAGGFLLGDLVKPTLRAKHARLLGATFAGGIVLPLLMQVTTLSLRRTSRFSVSLTSLLVVVGGLVTRYAILQAGKDSADDPQQYFEYTQR